MDVNKVSTTAEKEIAVNSTIDLDMDTHKGCTTVQTEAAVSTIGLDTETNKASTTIQTEAAPNRAIDLDVETNKVSTTVKTEAAANNTIDLNMDKRTSVAKEIMIFEMMCKNRAMDQEFQKQPEMERMIRISEDCKKKEVLIKQFKDELKFIKEKYEGFQKIYRSVQLEKQRKNIHDFIKKNRHCSQLKKVWTNRGLPVDRVSLQAAAASKDSFDMRSLNESLPSDTRSDSEKEEKEFNAYMRERQAIRRSVLSRRLAYPELNNNLPSCSSKVHQPGTLTDMVKRMCGNVKNIHALSIRPTIRPLRGGIDDLDSYFDIKRGSLPEPQKLSTSLEEQNERMRNSREKLIEMKNKIYQDLESTFVNMKARKRDDNKKKQIETAQGGQNLNFENNCHFSVPICHQIINERDGRISKVLLDLQREQVKLSREMSRLKIANCKREGVSEGMDESEIKEASSDQNKDEQCKALSLNAKKDLKQKLRNLIEIHKTDARFSPAGRSIKSS